MTDTTQAQNEEELPTFDPKHTALLIIDELGSLEGSDLESVLGPAFKQSARLAEAARTCEIPVIFCNDAHLPRIDKELELWGPHCIAGTPGAKISPLHNPTPFDFIIEKRRYSAFFQTSLLLLLNELHVTTLIVCGVDTNICVRHTAADAYFNNFSLFVASDATATFLYGDQQEGLQYLQKCYGAHVATTDDLISLMAGEE
jgi:nicotinamidase-related amidase